MQGINKGRHVNLMNALVQLEGLTSAAHAGEYPRETSKYRDKLHTMHCNYEHLLDELERMITDYEVLYSHVKIKFLGKKLKELKKEIPVEKPAFLMLQASIMLACGT
jgi:hypothetical protein